MLFFACEFSVPWTGSQRLLPTAYDFLSGAEECALARGLSIECGDRALGEESAKCDGLTVSCQPQSKAVDAIVRILARL